MTLYMYQASYTAKSMAAQLTEPHDPMEAIGPVLADLGAKVGVAGFPFREDDLLLVYEAPDDVSAASVAMAVAAAGEVKSAKTTRLLSGQEWLESLRKRRIIDTRKESPQHYPPESRYAAAEKGRPRTGPRSSVPGRLRRRGRPPHALADSEQVVQRHGDDQADDPRQVGAVHRRGRRAGVQGGRHERDLDRDADEVGHDADRADPPG